MAHQPRFNISEAAFNPSTLPTPHHVLALNIPVQVLADDSNASILRFKTKTHQIARDWRLLFGLFWWFRDVIEAKHHKTVVTTFERVARANSPEQTVAYRMSYYIPMTVVNAVSLIDELKKQIALNYKAASNQLSPNQLHELEQHGEYAPAPSAALAESSSTSSAVQNSAAPDSGPRDGAAAQAPGGSRRTFNRGARAAAMQKPHQMIPTFGKYLALISLKNNVDFSQRRDTDILVDPYEAFSQRNAMHVAGATPAQQDLSEYRTLNARRLVTGHKAPNTSLVFRLQDETLMWHNIDGMSLTQFSSAAQVENDPELSVFNSIHAYDTVSAEQLLQHMTEEEVKLLRETSNLGEHNVFLSSLGSRSTSNTATYAQLRDDNLKRLALLGRKFEEEERTQPNRDPDAAAASRHAELQLFQHEAIKQLTDRCLNTHCSDNSTAYKSMLEHVRIMLERHDGLAHFTIDKLSSNLSAIEDQIVRHKIVYDTGFRCISCHESSELGWWAHLGSSDPIRTEKLHILRYGAAGVHKSYILDLISNLSIKDTFVFSSYESARAKISEGTDDGTSIVSHEGSPETLGVTNNTRGNRPGSEGAATGFATSEQAVRNRSILSEGIIHFSYLTNRPRETKHGVRRHNVGSQVNVNFAIRELDKAVVDRYYTSEERPVKRKDRDLLSVMSAEETDVMHDYKQWFIEEKNWEQALCMLVHILIDVGILRGVNTKVARLYNTRVLKDAGTRGFFNTSKTRHAKRLLAAVRINTVREAVHHLFFSDLSPIKGHRYTDGVRGILNHLLLLQPLLVCTNLGMIVHVLGAMQNMYSNRLTDECWRTIRRRLLLPQARKETSEMKLVVPPESTDWDGVDEDVDEEEEEQVEGFGVQAGGVSAAAAAAAAASNGAKRTSADMAAGGAVAGAARGAPTAAVPSPQSAPDPTLPSDVAELDLALTALSTEDAVSDMEREASAVSDAILDRVQREIEGKYDAGEPREAEPGETTEKPAAANSPMSSSTASAAPVNSPQAPEGAEGVEGAANDNNVEGADMDAPTDDAPATVDFSLDLPSHDGSYQAVAEHICQTFNASHVDELLPGTRDYAKELERLLAVERRKRERERIRRDGLCAQWEAALESTLSRKIKDLQSGDVPQGEYYALKHSFANGRFATNVDYVGSFAALTLSNMDPVALPRIEEVYDQIHFLSTNREQREAKVAGDNEEDGFDDEFFGDLASNRVSADDIGHGKLISFTPSYVYLAKYPILHCDGGEFMRVVRDNLEHRATRPRTFLWNVPNYAFRPYRSRCFTAIPQDREFVTSNPDVATSGMCRSIMSTLPRIQGRVPPRLDREWNGSRTVPYVVPPERYEFYTYAQQCNVPLEQLEKLGMAPQEQMQEEQVLHQLVRWEMYRIEFARYAAEHGVKKAQAEFEKRHVPNRAQRYPRLLDEVPRTAQDVELERMRKRWKAKARRRQPEGARGEVLHYRLQAERSRQRELNKRKRLQQSQASTDRLARLYPVVWQGWKSPLLERSPAERQYYLPAAAVAVQVGEERKEEKREDSGVDSGPEGEAREGRWTIGDDGDAGGVETGRMRDVSTNGSTGSGSGGRAEGSQTNSLWRALRDAGYAGGSERTADSSTLVDNSMLDVGSVEETGEGRERFFADPAHVYME